MLPGRRTWGLCLTNPFENIGLESSAGSWIPWHQYRDSRQGFISPPWTCAMANPGSGVKIPTWVRDLGTLRSPPPKEILIGLAVCAAYIVAGKLSLRLASVHPSATPVWPPTGIAIATPVAATFGVTSLALGGFASWSDYGLIWRTWWLGDAAGALIFTPFLLLWTSKARWHWTSRQLLELSVIFSCTLLTAGIIFGPLFHTHIRNDPWTFLAIPFLVWAAFRFGTREATAIIVLLCTVEVIGTVHGYGPFVRETTNHSLLLLQSFISLKALMILIFAAEVSERRHQEEHARALAVSDPLTGLANYRLLLERLDSEIKRYLRDGPPFSVLLLDLDGLKKINDEHGHLVGSLALCRIAEVLLLSCRAVDTAARYGGDEFAVVLPGTSSEHAKRVAQRIAERLKEDLETPKLSASIGIAEYPRDGSTIEHMLSAADRALYDEKRRAAGRSAAAKSS